MAYGVEGGPGTRAKDAAKHFLRCSITIAWAGGTDPAVPLNDSIAIEWSQAAPAFPSIGGGSRADRSG
jgi:hypothetical protein